MAKKNQTIIRILHQIAEKIDNISLNDPDAWHKIRNELGAAPCILISPQVRRLSAAMV